MFYKGQYIDKNTLTIIMPTENSTYNCSVVFEKDYSTMRAARGQATKAAKQLLKKHKK